MSFIKKKEKKKKKKSTITNKAQEIVRSSQTWLGLSQSSN
jgi:hypothetical protein